MDSTNEYDLTSESRNFTYSCSKLEISFILNITIYCDDKTMDQIQFDEIDYLNVNVSDTLIFSNQTSKYLNLFNNIIVDYDKYILQIGKLIHLNKNINVRFYHFSNLSLIESFINLFPDCNINPWINLDWDYISITKNKYCPWDQNSYYNIIRQDKLFIRDMLDEFMKNQSWRKVCLSFDAWLYYSERKNFDKEEIRNITPTTLIVSIIIAIVIIFVVVLSLYIIAIIRYKKGNTYCRSDDLSLSF